MITGPTPPSMARATDLLRQGTALMERARDAEAIACFRAAVRLAPDFPDAQYELGSALHQAGQLEDAAEVFRKLLRAAPAHVPAKLALGGVLIDAKRPTEAEVPLRRALREPASPRLKAALHTNLGLALRRQRKDREALENYDSAMLLDPALPDLDIHRAEAMQNLGRYDEAITTYLAALACEPHKPQVHRLYNDLLYRLNRTDEYLKSYDRAPSTRELQLGKALFLSQDGHCEEALAIYRSLLVSDRYDKVAAAGAAKALGVIKRFDEAAKVLDAALVRHIDDAVLFSRAAEIAILQGDPQKALMLCGKGLAVTRYDQNCLATISAAFRMMEDERDEILNGYDSLVQIFDLEAPEGFSRMEDFNAELCAALDRMHPETREFINQSLKGGTQTPDHIFGAGHDLVDRLEQRIAEALRRYIAALREDDNHPFLSRRSRRFQYTGSWSSRLKDCGFHVNHIHPQGWISSCYYVGVPEAVQDERAREGWIKFGEPGFDLVLKSPVRRAVQPVQGRLVLFPSYMWHGTNPFHDAAARTTIAFDISPCRA
jgi:tetratricopeptide (TPR) repeat protein